MNTDSDSNETLAQKELIKKYWFAGKIRLVSFSLLLFFLLLMKSIGGYSYVNASFIALICVEAIVNQPYAFLIRRANIFRFQYYQMATDIIAISWILYYMGGIEAPLVNMAYYAVILWAGVVSSVMAVFFAVVLSALLYSTIIVFEHTGLLPYITHYHYQVPDVQIASIVIGNCSFIFAFGYFSAYASRMIKFLERKRSEESLKYAHRFIATGYLVEYTVHDALNHLANISGYAKLLREKEGSPVDENETLRSIDALGQKSVGLLSRLLRFSKKPDHKCEPVSINGIIEEALELTYPLFRYTKIAIVKILNPHIPMVIGEKDRLQELFVALILNSLKAMPDIGTLIFITEPEAENNGVKIIVSDTGTGINPENISRIKAGEPLFSAEDSGLKLGLGLITTHEIVTKHGGKIDIESTVGKGTTFAIQLPAQQREKNLPASQ